MVWILNGIWNPEAQSFEIRTNGCHFIINRLKSRQKCPDFKWSSFWIVGTIAIAKAWPFENRLSKVQISNVSGFQMVRFQIPTVFVWYSDQPTFQLAKIFSGKNAINNNFGIWIADKWLLLRWNLYHRHVQPDLNSGQVHYVGGSNTKNVRIFNGPKLFDW